MYVGFATTIKHARPAQRHPQSPCTDPPSNIAFAKRPGSVDRNARECVVIRAVENAPVHFTS
eukprot:2998840-Lingulodinium_polyedra.AAC.1